MPSVVTFVWPHSGPNSVQLAGTFNSWQPADMGQVEKRWQLELEVPEGHHQFKFVVDGQWMHDVNQDNAQNEVGTFNNIIHVEGTKKAMIEVERKFAVPDNFADLLPKHGFKQQAEETLRDDYYDTESYCLLRNDYYLRKRNGDWELKYPASVGDGQSTVFHETGDSKDILCKLRSVGAVVEEQPIDLGDLTDGGHLTCFAKVESKRWCFKKENVTVVVDTMDGGFRVGEVEIMVANKKDVPQAVKNIERIAKELNFDRFDVLKAAKRQLVE